jgi:flagellar motility protein MotE (MotC chaperone)
MAPAPNPNRPDSYWHSLQFWVDDIRAALRPLTWNAATSLLYETKPRPLVDNAKNLVPDDQRARELEEARKQAEARKRLRDEADEREVEVEREEDERDKAEGMLSVMDGLSRTLSDLHEQYETFEKLRKELVAMELLRG